MTLWATIQGFTCHYFEPFEDGPELKPFEQLISVWRSKCRGSRVPAWLDFDFTDFAGWHSKLAIYDISYDPFDYRIVLSGEEFNQVLGRNMKGKSKENIATIFVEDKFIDDFYEKVMLEMLVSYSRGITIFDRQHVQIELLELPLTDNGLHTTRSIEVLNMLKP